MSIEGLIAEAGNAVAEPAKNFLFSAISYVASCSDNMDTLEEQVKMLRGKAEEVKKDLEDAERKDQSATSEVSLWLDCVEKLQVEQTKMEAEFERMCKCIGSYSPNLVSMYRLSTRAEKLRKRAEYLYANIPPVSRTSDPNQFVERLCVQHLVGRGSVLEKLQELALDQNVSIIGIYGMAGVGKTELLNKFYMDFHERSKRNDINKRNERSEGNEGNERSEATDGHRMIWVDMKDRDNVEKTQKAITERLGLLWDDNDKQEVRANRILRNLNKKKFVLILDDMWTAVNLKDVGIPIAAQQVNSKVILATRREDICDTMEAEKIRIKCLDSKEAWSLFVEKAGKDLNESEQEILRPEIRHQAEILVKKCGGLPLALVTIGRAMARKRTPDLWKHAVTTLENTPQHIRGMEAVLSCLKLSYVNLPDDEKLRTCLLYCTLFPEDHDIYKYNIVDYCIGEGVLVDRFYEGDNVYNEGSNLLDVLKSASMLEPCSGPDYVKMHPMIRTLALWMESGPGETKCLIRAGKGLAEAPDVDDWSGVERISLMYNNIETLSEMPNSPGLVTLLLAHNPLLHEICDGFFRSMTNLRVLDLSNSSIQEVPPEIGDLVQLQYLDFCGTEITSLPQRLGRLVRLRYFLLSDMPNLKSIPDRLIKSLSKLRVLYMHCSYDNWKVDSVGDGVDFEELHFLKRLKTLGISVNTVLVLRKFAGSYRLANCTSRLEIKYCPGLKSTLSTETVGSTFKALKRLFIYECSDLKELSIDASHDGSSSLPNLDVLVLYALPRTILTWNSGRLQNLRFLTIYYCVKIRQLIHCDYGCTDEEDEGEVLEEERPRAINVVPNLYQLKLYDLPELESLSCGSRPLAFPTLEILIVRNCHKLKKLPLHAEKLQKIVGQNSWWNGLDWTEDHHDIKSKFQSIFEEVSEPNSQVERHAAAGWEAEDKKPEYEKLLQLAIDDGVNIMGVYGMAGVGKTRLLDNFFYRFHLRDDYQMVWVDMDARPNVEDTRKAVARKLGVTGHQYRSQEELARIISEFLNRKNFILILDNVWTVVDLDAIGIPTATRRAKHKIILSTRNEDICDRMMAIKFHAKCLEWDEAWSLFVEKAGQKLIDSDPMIRRHAATLVKKCGGLPLALITIGRAMAKKRNPEMWEHAVEALENNPQQIRGMKDVFSCLKLSFDHLVDDNSRTCLLYCFLLGEDVDIPKELIIEYWVGEGVLDGIELYNEGDKLLDVLKAKSLLGDGSNSDFVKVHPMIHIFAMWTAGDSWLMQAKKELTEIPDVAKWRGAERISLFGNNIKALSGRPDSPALLTLLLHNNPIEKICNGFFQYMKNLRVLDLSLTSIQEVPAIGELIELQYLNLSGTRINALPKELGNLIRLRSLGLSDVPSLKKIPQGLIARLTDLRALSIFRSYTGWKIDSDGDEVGFEELHCLKLLKALWISVNTAITLQKLAASPLLANCARLLEITLSQGLTTLSTAAFGSEFKALKSLLLHQCSDLEELAIDNGSCEGLYSLPHLETIELSELPRAKITWKSGRLQSLVYLQIYSCGGIRQLIHCDDDESIKEGEAEKQVLEEINILPNLQQLSLYFLPELESLSCGSKPLAFPTLQVLQVVDCPKLKKIPLNAEKLQRIEGKRSWWYRLDWPEDSNIESKYKSIFVEARHTLWYVVYQLFP